MQYILRCQSKVDWVWGPVTQLSLDLDGIDSLGETNNDVMELVAVIGADPRTQEMLLEDFMQGFLHKLFDQKRKQFGFTFHVAMRIFDGLYLIGLMTLMFGMKVPSHSHHTAIMMATW